MKPGVLVIGCGNIGALYDFKKNGITTHVKAFSQDRSFQISVFDQDRNLARKIADHYQLQVLGELNDKTLQGFDVAVISTPTPTHYDLLKECLRLKLRVIICEKPITDSLVKLEDLRMAKNGSVSKVLVNYFRRFHPCYRQLKEFIQNLNEEPINIQVTYQRGFLNNGTHALDLLNYLFGYSPLQDVRMGNFAFDEFEYDPTISLTATFRSATLTMQGLQFVKYSFFEIRLWFRSKLISIENSGESIHVYSAMPQTDSTYYLPLTKTPSPFDQLNAIADPMKHVVDTVRKYLDDPLLEDNFEASLLLNQQSLKIIEDLCRS